MYHFLIVKDGDEDADIIIFRTDKNIELLSESDMIYIDGTFQTSLTYFLVFFIHALSAINSKL